MRAFLFTWACVWAAGAASANPGILEWHAVFPRNDTYSPTDVFPVIFAISNPELLLSIPFQITLSIEDRDNRNASTTRTAVAERSGHLLLADDMPTNGEPYFVKFALPSFKWEGTWRIYWDLTFMSCEENAEADLGSFEFYRPVLYDFFTGFIDFSTNHSAPEYDLVAATSNEDNCPIDAFALNVTKTRGLSDRESMGSSIIGWGDSEQCGILGSSGFTPESCQIKLDTTFAAEVSTYIDVQRADFKCSRELTREACKAADDLKNAKNAAHTSAAGGWTFLIATGVSLGYILIVSV